MMAKGYEQGFGYLRGVAIDQHLLVRRRPDDLVEVIDKKPELLGLGIDEPAAIVVQGDRLEVIGQSVVGIYDGKDHDGKKYYFLGTRRPIRPAIAQARGRGDQTSSHAVAATASDATDPAQTAKPALDAFIKAHADTAWEMARKIWDWAEVGYQEKRSAALLADAMEAGGFKVERGVAGIPDVVHRHHRLGQAGDRDPGRIRRLAGPFPASRARPSGSARRDGRARLRPPSLRGGLGHGVPGAGRADRRPARSRGRCGSTAARPRKGEVPRRSWSEPTCSTTATPCSTGIRRARTRPAMRSSQARIAAKFRFHGTSSHAAAAPEAGRSALDAIELTNHAAELLREHTPDFTRIHHVVTAGGSAPNVVPDFGEVFYYIRHPRSAVRANALSSSCSNAPKPALCHRDPAGNGVPGRHPRDHAQRHAGTGGACEPVEAQRSEIRRKREPLRRPAFKRPWPSRYL